VNFSPPSLRYSAVTVIRDEQIEVTVLIEVGARSYPAVFGRGDAATPIATATSSNLPLAWR
jgi:hypothetical protein